MYSPETRAEIEQIRALMPTLIGDSEEVREKRKDLMRRVVALIREGRVSASITSAASKARKAKVAVVDGDALLADLEGGP